MGGFMAIKGNELIWSFDLGTGSVGECARKGKEIIHIQSLLLPNDFGSLKEARERRRQIRTRDAHKKREQWWREQAKKAGVEVLETGHLNPDGAFIKPDERISRQFSEGNDKTIYASCLLRVALLQGKKLGGWQIFKAVWSAIQRRGYDADLPWKREVKRNVSDAEPSVTTASKENTREKNDESDNGEKDERENLDAVRNYQQELEKVFKDERYRLPCYYEAYRLGIWDPRNPSKLDGKLGSNPEPARNKDNRTSLIPPRALVAKELLAMLTQASKQYPKLKDKVRYVLYGPGEEEYTSYKNEKYAHYRGTEWDAQGLLSQKIPRFDNRIISKCALIPRFNVCCAKIRKDKNGNIIPESTLPSEVTFLLKLKNIRYTDTTTTTRGKTEKPLSPAALKELFNTYNDTKHITPKQLDKYIKTNLPGGLPPVNLAEIEKPKTSGRSRLCRPALRIIKEIILSGESPRAYHKKWLATNKNKDPRKGLVSDDLKFLLDMPADWEKFCIPDKRIEESELKKSEREKRIAEILGGITNPVVRHRLNLFLKRLAYLKDKCRDEGEPSKIILEFAREGEESFQGQKNKNRQKWEKLQKENRAKKDEAYESLKTAKATGQQSLLKMMLFKEQIGYDFYSKSPLVVSKLDSYEIDHIVPREAGGSDAYINKILTNPSSNREKGRRAPYEWLSSDKTRWLEFVKTVSESKLHEKKKALLTSDNPLELINKYTDLASTAYISKLAQRLIHLFFGWPQLTEGSTRKVIVANGGLTAKLRRQYKLDRLLHPGIPDNEFAEIAQGGKLDEKNRDNPRHHALDALVISMMPEITLDPRSKKDVLPNWFHKDYCRLVIEKVYPQRLRFEKPRLAATIYGLRKITDEKTGECRYAFVSRYIKGGRVEHYEYDKPEQKKQVSHRINTIFDARIRQDFAEEFKKSNISGWSHFIHNYTIGGTALRRVLQIESFVDKETGEKLEKGELTTYGEYIRGQMSGQWLKNKDEFLGFIVYKNKKDKWEREPIYVFESLYNKIESLKKNPEIKDPVFFRSGMLVEIKQDCNLQNTKNKVTSGRWYLNTIMHNNFVKLTSIDGYCSVLSSLTETMGNGKMSLAQ